MQTWMTATLLIAGAIGWACSPTDSNQSVAGGQSNGGSDAGTTGAGGSPSGGQAGQDGGSGLSAGGSASSTEDCPVWPKEKLFPYVGPYFYGSDPGPCSTTVQGIAYTFNYDSSNMPTGITSDDGLDVTTYTFEQGVLVGSIQVKESRQTMTTFEYSDGTMSYAITDETGPMVKYDYALDARGYPQAIVGSGRILGATSTNHYQYVYENCRQTKRIAYKPDNTEDTSAELRIVYDDQGRIVRRESSLSLETFDYSCW